MILANVERLFGNRILAPSRATMESNARSRRADFGDELNQSLFVELLDFRLGIGEFPFCRLGTPCRLVPLVVRRAYGSRRLIERL